MHLEAFLRFFGLKKQADKVFMGNSMLLDSFFTFNGFFYQSEILAGMASLCRAIFEKVFAADPSQATCINVNIVPAILWIDQKRAFALRVYIANWDQRKIYCSFVIPVMENYELSGYIDLHKWGNEGWCDPEYSELQEADLTQVSLDQMLDYIEFTIGDLDQII